MQDMEDKAAADIIFGYDDAEEGDYSETDEDSEVFGPEVIKMKEEDVDSFLSDDCAIIYIRQLERLANLKVERICSVKGCKESVELKTSYVGSAVYITWAGQDKECKDILKWTQDITTHFWHACKHANTYGEFLTIWAGVLHHVVDEHEWALSYGSMDYGQCSHSALETDREKPWLKKGSKAHEALRRIVLDKRLLNNVPYYLNFRSTAELENFHTHILMYAAKRFAYTPPVYKARSQLAAIDYNEHIERPAALTKEGKKIYHRTFNKKSERWSAVEVKVKKTYAYIKNLLHNIFCMRLRDRVGMNRRMELAPDDPRRLSSHLASVEPKPTSELVTEKLSRF
ncbi:hypothetical protein FSP39_010109 [Pinctada imbricata]|uniref:Uncharacterized protein n=1 Tax=Pinctada imbricata TaxID=66713 RepID=A0AA88XKY2_PINIB|nr:hypothetical protein FSP39_010109 [Pinctada imbricata]